jgi:hypothetical protein
VFAEVDAGDGSPDGAEFAADLRGGIRFGVEGFVKGRSAEEIKEDDGLGFPASGDSLGLLGAEKAVESHAEKGESSQAKRFATIESAADHGFSPAAIPLLALWIGMPERCRKIAERRFFRIAGDEGCSGEKT